MFLSIVWKRYIFTWVSMQRWMGPRQSGRGAGCHYQALPVAGPTAVEKNQKQNSECRLHLCIILTKYSRCIAPWCQSCYWRWSLDLTKCKNRSESRHCNILNLRVCPFRKIIDSKVERASPLNGSWVIWSLSNSGHTNRSYFMRLKVHSSLFFWRKC